MDCCFWIRWLSLVLLPTLEKQPELQVAFPLPCRLDHDPCCKLVEQVLKRERNLDNIKHHAW